MSNFSQLKPGDRIGYSRSSYSADARVATVAKVTKTLIFLAEEPHRKFRRATGRESPANSFGGALISLETVARVRERQPMKRRANELEDRVKAVLNEVLYGRYRTVEKLEAIQPLLDQIEAIVSAKEDV